jgi:hypothetical protein
LQAIQRIRVVLYLIDAERPIQMRYNIGKLHRQESSAPPPPG